MKLWSQRFFMTFVLLAIALMPVLTASYQGLPGKEKKKSWFSRVFSPIRRSPVRSPESDQVVTPQSDRSGSEGVSSEVTSQQSSNLATPQSGSSPVQKPVHDAVPLKQSQSTEDLWAELDEQTDDDEAGVFSSQGSRDKVTNKQIRSIIKVLKYPAPTMSIEEDYDRSPTEKMEQWEQRLAENRARRDEVRKEELKQSIVRNSATMNRLYNIVVAYRNKDTYVPEAAPELLFAMLGYQLGKSIVGLAQYEIQHTGNYSYDEARKNLCAIVDRRTKLDDIIKEVKALHRIEKNSKYIPMLQKEAATLLHFYDVRAYEARKAEEPRRARDAEAVAWALENDDTL